LYKVIFTVVSRLLNHDSKTVVGMLKEILQHNVFKYFNTKEVEFWMDNAPNHFRTKEMIAGFYDIWKNNKMEVRFEFFTEYHGKSECDRHFGLISRLYSDHCAKPGKKNVNTTDEFITLYKSSIFSYGGNVIPSQGAYFEELHGNTIHKLNVVCFEYMPEEYVEALENFEKEREKSKKRSKNVNENGKSAERKISFLYPYSRRIISVSKKFTFSNYYSFKFQRVKNEDILTSKLTKNTSRKETFACSISEVDKTDYKLRFGVITAEKGKFAFTNSVIKKYQFHLAKQDD